jgi:RsiW-degrading membrane proteinase PrsW (M82 family)
MSNVAAIIAVAVLPALVFLGVLVRLDSYKLTSLRLVLSTLAAGAASSVVAYWANGAALSGGFLELSWYSRFGAPFVEEIVKALVIVWLLRTDRIGLLVDGAILGFAVGAGFGVTENVFYMIVTPHASVGTWIVRGLGTALMHGATTSIFAILAVTFAEESGRWRALRWLPGLLIAVAVHSIFNQLPLPPVGVTMVTIIALPWLLFETYQRGQRRLSDWLGTGFDADAAMLELLDSGGFTDSPLGRYLQSLKDRFAGPVVADILCYVRIHTELALRAKGLLMMRENGLDVPLDDETRARFEELEYLERSIGATGRLAIRPVLHTSRKDLWQLNVLTE